MTTNETPPPYLNKKPGPTFKDYAFRVGSGPQPEIACLN